MKVMFICEGNTYRSRLAAAYLKSRDVPGLQVSSSGVHAKRNANGPITPYARILLEQYELTSYDKKSWDQLTQAMLDKADVVVCVNRKVHQDCLADFSMPPRTFVWDIADINKMLPSYEEQLSHDQVPKIMETTFDLIRVRVDELIAILSRVGNPERLDILNPDGTPLGKTANIADVHKWGYWHSGVHIALYTEKGDVVIERRSKSIIFNPGLWDLTLGGFVAAGEVPRDAVIRETAEEIGVQLTPDQLQEIFVQRYNHHLPHYGMHNKTFVHTYIALIKPPKKFKLQESEVSDARLVPLHEAKKMLVGHHHGPLGDMSEARRYNLRIMAAIEARLEQS